MHTKNDNRYERGGPHNSEKSNDTLPGLIREALIDLYLSVKIRKNSDLDKLSADAYRLEKAKLKKHKHLDEATLVNYIQECISILMRMRLEEFMDHRKDVIAID